MNPEFPLFTKRRKKVFSEGLRKEAKKQQERAAKARLAGQASGKARNNKDLPMNSELTRSISQVELGTNTPTPTVSVSSLTKRDPPIVPPKRGDGKADSTTKEKDPRIGLIVKAWIDLARHYLTGGEERGIAARVGAWAKKGTKDKPAALAFYESRFSLYDPVKLISRAFEVFFRNRDDPWVCNQGWTWNAWLNREAVSFQKAADALKDEARLEQRGFRQGGLTGLGDIMRQATLAAEGEHKQDE